MMDRATGRVVAVIVLLIAIAASLRGYLPGVERAEQQRPPDNGSSLFYVSPCLACRWLSWLWPSLSGSGTRVERRPVPAACRTRFSGGRGRPAWRVLLIGAGLLVVWLLVVWLLSRFTVLGSVGQVQSTPASVAPAPANNVSRPPQPRDVGGDRSMLHYLIASTVAVLVLIVVGAIGATRRRRIGEAPIVAAVMPPTGHRRCGHLAGTGGGKRTGGNRRPQSRTAAGDHRVLRGDGTRTATFPRSRPAGFRHSDRGFDPGRRTSCVARRHCRRAGEPI